MVSQGERGGCGSRGPPFPFPCLVPPLCTPPMIKQQTPGSLHPHPLPPLTPLPPSLPLSPAPPPPPSPSPRPLPPSARALPGPGGGEKTAEMRREEWGGKEEERRERLVVDWRGGGGVALFVFIRKVLHRIPPTLPNPTHLCDDGLHGGAGLSLKVRALFELSLFLPAAHSLTSLLSVYLSVGLNVFSFLSPLSRSRPTSIPLSFSQSLSQDQG